MKKVLYMCDNCGMEIKYKNDLNHFKNDFKTIGDIEFDLCTNCCIVMAHLLFDKHHKYTVTSIVGLIRSKSMHLAIPYTKNF